MAGHRLSKLLLVADLNGDGRADIVVWGGGGFEGSVTVELAQPGGGQWVERKQHRRADVLPATVPASA